MLCPACKTDLVMSERQGIEIDYCPKCRGVWLDRGELDKIVERSGQAENQMRERYAAPPERSGHPDGRGYRRDRDRDDDDDGPFGGGFGGPGGFLGRLFD